MNVNFLLVFIPFGKEPRGGLNWFNNKKIRTIKLENLELKHENN